MTATRVSPASVAVPASSAAVPRLSGLDVLAVLALLVLAAALRAGPLAPGSLWIDDAWISLVTRADGIGEIWLMGLTAPGFAFALAGVLNLVGFSEGAAQALPFALGVGGPPLLYLVARVLRLHPAAALLGAGILLTSPELLTYATRVKHYTAEVAVAVLLLAVGLAILRRPGSGRRWAALAALAIGGIFVSSAVAVTAGAAVAAGGVAALRSPDRRALRPALLAGGVVAAFAGAWAVLVVGPRTNEALSDYWEGFYSLGGVTGVLEGLVPLPVAVSAGLALAAAVVVARRDPALAVLLVGPLLLAGLLAVAERAPLGGGRTDLHLYPSLTMLGVVALDAVLPRSGRPARLAVTAAAVATAGLVVLTPGPEPYFAEDLAPLVASLEEQTAPDDLVVVFPSTRWAYALYTSRPVDLRADPVASNGFDVEIGGGPADPDVVVLPDELENERSSELLEEPGAAGLAAVEDSDRVWLVTSHTEESAVEAVEAFLTEEGLSRERGETRPGADIALWTR